MRDRPPSTRPDADDPDAPDALDALDALDARIDYEQIAAWSEADRRAGRLVAHDDVARQVEAWLGALEDERRPA